MQHKKPLLGHRGKHCCLRRLSKLRRHFLFSFIYSVDHMFLVRAVALRSDEGRFLCCVSGLCKSPALTSAHMYYDRLTDLGLDQLSHHPCPDVLPLWT